jgi:hypothetical protein
MKIRLAQRENRHISSRWNYCNTKNNIDKSFTRIDNPSAVPPRRSTDITSFQTKSNNNNFHSY